MTQNQSDTLDSMGYWTALAVLYGFWVFALAWGAGWLWGKYGNALVSAFWGVMAGVS